MNTRIKKVSVDEKEILRNLLEKYNYEFSRWNLEDVNFLGQYGYDYLDCYWTDENRYAFFIFADNKLAGFAMINNIPEAYEPADYSVAEFFVMYKYRKDGVGRYVANELFNMFRGKWQIKMHPKNVASVCFWNKVVGEYTKGNYRLSEFASSEAYGDGTKGHIIFFEN